MNQEKMERPYAVVLKGTYKVVSTCPSCDSVTEEIEFSGQADWICPDLPFLLDTLQDDVEDLIRQFQEHYEEIDANHVGDAQ